MTQFMVIKDGRERVLMRFIDLNAFMAWVRTQGEVKIVAPHKYHEPMLPQEYHEPMQIEVKTWHQAAA